MVQEFEPQPHSEGTVLQKAGFILAILLWAFLAFHAPRVSFRTGWSGDLDDGTEAVAQKSRVDEFLGGEKEYSSWFLYAERPEGIFDNRYLEALTELTARLEASGYFDPESIKSLDRLVGVSFEQGWIESGEFVDADLLPLTEEEMSSLRSSLEEAEPIRGFLVNGDASGTAVVATYAGDPPDRLTAHQWQLDLQQWAREEYGFRLDVLDDVYLNAQLDQRAMTDTVVWPGLAALTIAGVCYLLCGRRLRHVGGFFLLAGMSISSFFGLLHLLGIPFSVIFVFIPILLIITAGSDYPYFALRDSIRDPRELLRRLWLPISLAAATTAVSSFSLTASGIDQIRQFGLVAGIGILLNSFYALTVIPLYFTLLNRRGSGARTPTPVPAVPDRLTRWLDRLHGKPQSRTGVLARVGLTLLLAVPLVLLLPWTDDVVIDYFDEEHPVVEAAWRAGEEFGGIDYLKIVVNDPEGFRSLPALQRLAEFQARVEALTYREPSAGEKAETLLSAVGVPIPGTIRLGGPDSGLTLMETLGRSRPVRFYGAGMVGRVLSVADLIAYVNGQWTGADKPVLPESQRALDYLMDNFMGDTLVRFRNDLFNDEFTQVAIDLFLTSSDTRVHEQAFRDVMDIADEMGLEVAAGGYNMKWLTYKQHILSLMVNGVARVMLVVGLLTWAGFGWMSRSPWRGLWCAGIVLMVIAVLLLWLLAGMNLLGIKLNIATGTVLAIGLGIGVNFAVHLVYAMLREPNLKACHRTVRSLFTDLATSACFLFLLGSGIASIRHTGLQITLAVGAAFLSTLLLAPALFPVSFYASATRSRTDS